MTDMHHDPAGLVLEDVHYREFADRGERPLRELVQPIAGFLVPVFFVVMGARVELGALAEPRTIWLALALTTAVVIIVGLTTFATPPALKWSLQRHRGRATGASGEYQVRR